MEYRFVLQRNPLGHYALGGVQRIEILGESDVLIYALGIYEPWDLLDRTPEELAGPGLRKELAEQTGGPGVLGWIHE
jgi:hypothetical protein